MTQLSRVRSNRKQDKKSLPVRSLISTSLIRARSLVAKFKFVKQIANERRTLSQLSDHQLRDIGMTRDQIGTEVNRNILDLPAARFNQLDYRATVRESRQSRLTRTPKD